MINSKDEGFSLGKAMEEGLLTPSVTRTELNQVLNAEDTSETIKKPPLLNETNTRI